VSRDQPPRLFTLPPGVPFLPALADALADGTLVPGFRVGADPQALADVTIYVPTRRAARELRTVFVERSKLPSAVLPVIRPLGEFDEDAAAFMPGGGDAAALDPPIAAIDRLLMLAPLVRRWKTRLPAEVAGMIGEPIIVPASTADALWLSRDLAALMDEVETEGASLAGLGGLVAGNLAGWWQVTLKFLEIVAEGWPQVLAELRLSNPAAHRSALIRAEAERLNLHPPAGPVIAAGSTGSIPATAKLLSVIARLPQGAVVLPGLDAGMDHTSWGVIAAARPEPAVLGHPQYGLARLLRTIGVPRADVVPLAAAEADLARRAALVAEAFRPADTTDEWPERRSSFTDQEIAAALANVSLVEAVHERDEAAAIAIALRRAILVPGQTAALVTGDRDLARRVCAELARFGIAADDSGGNPLATTPPATLLRLLVSAVLRPGDPVPLLSLLKHPLLSLGMPRATVRRAASIIELVALRGGTGRPSIDTLPDIFARRVEGLTNPGAASRRRAPAWWRRLTVDDLDEALGIQRALVAAVEPLAELASAGSVDLATIVRRTAQALENLVRDEKGSVEELYKDDAGEKLAELLRGLVSTQVTFDLAASEFPDVVDALISPEMVKPSQGADSRVFVWGALEARLLSPDTLVIGGMNEGVWPRRAEADRFMSRLMKGGLSLEPPERRIGQSAHDLQMAMGAANVVLTRAARAGDAPSVASRWLQRLTTFVGKDATKAMRERGDKLLDLAHAIDKSLPVRPVTQPKPTPPLAARPKRFSVTEIETLRRDPYAIYARRILDLSPLDPLLRDPGAAERGTLFHEILHRFAASGTDPRRPDALAALIEAGRASFAALDLPADVQAVWWPRFEKLALNIVEWERGRADRVKSRQSEVHAAATAVGATGVDLSGYADRIDLLPGEMADILDFKTGSYPSRKQANTLLAPQLALEAALLVRDAFGLGRLDPADLAFVRLKPDGQVLHESILDVRGSEKSGAELAQQAWQRLEALLQHYDHPSSGYLSRALPFRERDPEGDYDHLARVLEWSAGGDEADDAE